MDHWDVNNEMLHGNFFTERTGDPDIRVKMFQWAQDRDPSTKKFVNDYEILNSQQLDKYGPDLFSV